MSTTINYCYIHHGALLKSYVIENKLNRKGGINKLAEKLSISRQAVYALYKKRELSTEEINEITELYDLPDNFFSMTAFLNPLNTALVIDLQRRLIQTQQLLIQTQERFLKRVMLST